MIKFFFILPIKIYQSVLSPFFGKSCRFEPTCSSYSIEAINQYGVVKGIILSIKRILKCHPWGSSGYDPVK
tara:strand:+ start:428 stop:640 length:213 start_codon:yes stop_codon:yes gene_type:complete